MPTSLLNLSETVSIERKSIFTSGNFVTSAVYMHFPAIPELRYSTQTFGRNAMLVKRTLSFTTHVVFSLFDGTTCRVCSFMMLYFLFNLFCIAKLTIQ